MRLPTPTARTRLLGLRGSPRWLPISSPETPAHRGPRLAVPAAGGDYRPAPGSVAAWVTGTTATAANQPPAPPPGPPAPPSRAAGAGLVVVGVGGATVSGPDLVVALGGGAGGSQSRSAGPAARSRGS